MLHQLFLYLDNPKLGDSLVQQTLNDLYQVKLLNLKLLHHELQMILIISNQMYPII